MATLFHRPARKRYIEPLKMKILLTGKSGQVGWELQRTLACLGEVIALDRQTLDLARLDSLRATIREIKPNLIVNAAAYTAVDKAESEPELAYAVNGVAPGVMAEEAKRLNALLVHYSTDYVFDGAKTFPYTEEDTPNPINVYGKTKLAGERAIQAVGGAYLIFRASWVYGARGKNFLLTILRLAKKREELRIVDDQRGAPTWSRLIGEATASIVSHLFRERSQADLASEIYHVTCAGDASWYDFARAIIDRSSFKERKPSIIAIPTAEYPLPACRPSYSGLSSSKLYKTFGVALPHWRYALTLCLDEVALTGAMG
jgi:dTDP-4-dehydrorhamnose reductase